MRRVFSLLMLGTLALPSPSRCLAQNVSGYAMIPEPFLFLLREPAVHDDLQLTRDQRTRLTEVNHSFDGILLATRNMPPERGQEKVARVMSESREQVARLLSDQQQSRLRQIAYQLRGVSSVLAPHASEQLQLSEHQKEEIGAIMRETLEEIRELQTTTYQGKEAHRKAQNAAAAARKTEQEGILKVLNGKQKQQLLTLIGRSFDPSRLGRVSFKAPELWRGDEWVNSNALQLKDLRGKVVALHFWTFG